MSNKLSELVRQILSEQEARVEKVKEERLKIARGAVSWFQLEAVSYNRQKKCTHLKGQIGARPAWGQAIDYNVAMHTFPTGETKIWCLSNCGWNVWNRPGWSFKWAHGLKMVEYSTNRASTSEISGEVISRKTQVIPGPTTFTGGYAVWKNKESK